MSDYSTFRGKCHEFCAELISKDPTLRLVRGHYYCPISNSRDPHWWCIDVDGKIIDPTARQFPSKGFGEYEEFDGFVTCAECGEKMEESCAMFSGNYAFCSHVCACRFVGVYCKAVK